MESSKQKTTIHETLKKRWNELEEAEKKMFARLMRREPISRDLNAELQDRRTYGERIADKVAAFGGSWTFIIIFGGVLTGWVILNSFVLTRSAFDPYPYILLNLFLSMLAAVQAPIIMMSQNRQAARDRLDATHDYEVNLKAEMEICMLQEKIDDLREQKWLDLIAFQQKQIELLEELLRQKN